ncbi:MAG: hypothetical protein ACFCGT_10170 [Sandaracinaceae bacterium]
MDPLLAGPALGQERADQHRGRDQHAEGLEREVVGQADGQASLEPGHRDLERPVGERDP